MTAWFSAVASARPLSHLADESGESTLHLRRHLDAVRLLRTGAHLSHQLLVAVRLHDCVAVETLTGRAGASASAGLHTGSSESGAPCRALRDEPRRIAARNSTC